jgi:hypothetical protein
MNAGQLLWDLVEARSPLADQAYQAVWKCASPSGEFSEMYDGSYRPYNPISWGVGTSGRVRPWEGGLDTEALLHYMTGFQPDAADATVRFAPHLPEGQDRFGAEGLVVGGSRVNFHLEKTSDHERTLSVKLTRGPSLKVRMDLWETRRVLSDVDTGGEAVWEKKPSERQGHEAVLAFVLKEGEERQLRWVEGEELSKEDVKPPAAISFVSPPLNVENADVLLFTSPSAVLASLQPLPPRKFQEGAQSERTWLEKQGFKTAVVDMDLPVRVSDVASALLDKDGHPKARVALFGRGAFTPGKHDFKPASFWEDEVIAKAVEKFLEGGGSVVIGPDTRGGESCPDWLKHLSHAGWEDPEENADAVLEEPPKISPKLTPTRGVGTPGPERLPSLAERLGFLPEALLGKVSRGLTFSGEGWKTPILVSGDPGNAALIMRRQGLGFLVKTELPLSACGGLLKVLGSKEKSQDLSDHWNLIDP